MIFELTLFGLITGFVSGFFGIGGGMVLVPMLLFSGFLMKDAVSISIMQMVFSSTFGSFLNTKKQMNIFSDGIILGIGGFIGGLLSYFITNNFTHAQLQYLFIIILLVSIIKIFKTKVQHQNKIKTPPKLYLILIGSLIGMIAMSIGVGGSIMLTPILIGFMNYNLKFSTSLSLFFVMFSSFAGFISLSLSGNMLYEEGLYVGIASLLGVYLGLKVKNITHILSYKKYILIMYLVILFSMLFKLF